MSDNAGEILEKIRTMEEELERRLEEKRKVFRYTVDRNRVIFEEAVHQQNKKLRTGIGRFLLNSGALQIVAAFVIYLQIIPLLLVDLGVTVFQLVCFPIYGISKVARGDFVVIDRHRLGYLNAIEKLNCVYCGYANGLLAYAREVAGRTEEHFCPIKHARRTRGQHRRYYDFADYGDGAEFKRKMQAIAAKSDAERAKTIHKDV